MEGRASGFHFIQLHFFHGDIRDPRKNDTFRSRETSRPIYSESEPKFPLPLPLSTPATQAILFINLLGKGLTQEINGDGKSLSIRSMKSFCIISFAKDSEIS